MSFRSLLAGALAFSVSVASVASAGEWSHLRRNSAEGHQIDVDYIVNERKDRTYKPNDWWWARPFYVNVRHPGFTGAERVRIVLNNYDLNPEGQRWASPVIYVLDLAWQGDHFSGNLDDAIVNRGYFQLGRGKEHVLTVRRDGYGGLFRFEQEIAVVIDGYWLKVPGQGGATNFQLDLYERR